MADANQYMSNYTGAQIDEAVAAYKNSAVRARTIVEIGSGSWEGNTGNSPKYSVTIASYGTVSLGKFPDVFLVNGNGEKVIPAISYSGDGSKITIYSNTNDAMSAVIYGAMESVASAESVAYRIEGTQEPFA